MRQRAACSPSGRVIGILGCEPGVGVTHLSVAIANYIGSKLKQKVLLVELNRQNDFLEIQKSYEGVGEEFVPLQDTVGPLCCVASTVPTVSCRGTNPSPFLWEAAALSSFNFLNKSRTSSAPSENVAAWPPSSGSSS